MSRYTPVTSSPSSPTTPTRRSSFVSLRRPSFSSFRLGSGTRSGPIPDPDEMDAAFDGPEDEGESHGLLGARDGHVPGDYDFERDYVSPPPCTDYELNDAQTLPPPSPPPFQPYSSHNPAPGNTNGLVPSSPPFRPTPARHLLGGILPTSLLPRAQSAPGSRVIGAGQTGVFANLSARPDNGASPEVADHPDYVPEIEQKDGPPVCPQDESHRIAVLTFHSHTKWLYVMPSPHTGTPPSSFPLQTRPLAPCPLRLAETRY
jgi:hypothetical protein